MAVCHSSEINISSSLWLHFFMLNVRKKCFCLFKELFNVNLSYCFSIKYIINYFQNTVKFVQWPYLNFAIFVNRKCLKAICSEFKGLGPATLLTKRFSYRCFPVNFVKYLRKPFL